MDKFLDWLSARFQQPLSLLFFLLGAFLILFGLSKEVKFGSGNATPDLGHQWLSLAVGLGFCGLAVLFYYLPAKKDLTSRRKGETEAITGTFSDLLDKEYLVTSATQRRILNLFETLSGSGVISQEELTATIQQKIGDLKNASVSEIYYRLEQLRWMGFVTKEDRGPQFLYRLSEAYRQYLAKL
jgi:hypothetical protein